MKDNALLRFPVSVDSSERPHSSQHLQFVSADSLHAARISSRGSSRVQNSQLVYKLGWRYRGRKVVHPVALKYPDQDVHHLALIRF